MAPQTLAERPLSSERDAVEIRRLLELPLEGPRSEPGCKITMGPTLNRLWFGLAGVDKDYHPGTPISFSCSSHKGRTRELDLLVTVTGLRLTEDRPDLHEDLGICYLFSGVSYIFYGWATCWHNHNGGAIYRLREPIRVRGHYTPDKRTGVITIMPEHPAIARIKECLAPEASFNLLADVVSDESPCDWGVFKNVPLTVRFSRSASALHDTSFVLMPLGKHDKSIEGYETHQVHVRWLVTPDGNLEVKPDLIALFYLTDRPNLTGRIVPMRVEETAAAPTAGAAGAPAADKAVSDTCPRCGNKLATDSEVCGMCRMQE